MTTPSGKTVPGVPVDAGGKPSVDPTDAVRALNEASAKHLESAIKAESRRLDELREMQNRLQEAETRRMDTLAACRAECNHEIAAIRDAHAREVRTLDSDRLEKIRAVDQLSGNTAADRALTAIQTLAQQTAVNADTLRQMVANTATTIATQLASTVAGINERISSLEKAQAAGSGRQSATDPVLVETMAELKRLTAAQAQGTGKSEGISSTVAVIIAVAGLILTLLGIGGAVLAMRPTSPQMQPQIQYVEPQKQATP